MKFVLLLIALVAISANNVLIFFSNIQNFLRKTEGVIVRGLPTCSEGIPAEFNVISTSTLTENTVYVATFEDGGEATPNTLQYDCTVQSDNTTLHCIKTSGEVITTYTIKSITNKDSPDDSFTIPADAPTLTIYPKSVSDTQTDVSITDPSTEKVVINLASGITQDNLPTFYYTEDDNDMLTGCTVSEDDSTASCSLPSQCREH